MRTSSVMKQFRVGSHMSVMPDITQMNVLGKNLSRKFIETFFQILIENCRPLKETIDQGWRNYIPRVEGNNLRKKFSIKNIQSFFSDFE